jgi:hypothetical protein
MGVAVDSIGVAPCWPYPPMAGTGPSLSRGQVGQTGPKLSVGSHSPDPAAACLNADQRVVAGRFVAARGASQRSAGGVQRRGACPAYPAPAPCRPRIPSAHVISACHQRARARAATQERRQPGNEEGARHVRHERAGPRGLGQRHREGAAAQGRRASPGGAHRGRACGVLANSARHQLPASRAFTHALANFSSFWASPASPHPPRGVPGPDGWAGEFRAGPGPSASHLATPGSVFTPDCGQTMAQQTGLRSVWLPCAAGQSWPVIGKLTFKVKHAGNLQCARARPIPRPGLARVLSPARARGSPPGRWGGGTPRPAARPGWPGRSGR